MSDIALTTVASGYNLGKINENFTKIQTAVNGEMLHLTGGNNVMSQNIDMNGNRLLNLPEPLTASEPLTKGMGDGIIASAEAARDAAIAAAADAANSADIAQDYPEGLLAAALAATDSTALVGGVEAGKINKKFDNVAEMASKSLEAGQTVILDKYYEDGSLVKGLVYYVKTSAQATVDGDVVDELINHTLQNGNIAVLATGGEISAKQAGAKCDGVNNDYSNAVAAKNHAIAKNLSDLDLTGVYCIGPLTISGASKLDINATDGVFTTAMVDQVPVLLSSCSRVGFYGAACSQPNGASSGYSAGGIVVNNSQLVDIKRCFVDATDFNGIVLTNVDGGYVERNTVTSSTVDPATIVTNNTSSGIALFDSTSNTTVSRNEISKVGIGVNVQAIGAGKDLYNNRVSKNNISDCYGYGINVYSLASIVYNTTLSGNTIDTIYGQVFNLAVSAYSHGAGIYLQNARGSITIKNTITNTNINTNNSSLVPASIGMNGGWGNLISSNRLKNTGYRWWGVAVINAPASDEPSLVCNNIVTGFAEGLRVNNSTNVNFSDNICTGNAKGFGGPSSVGSKCENININGGQFNGNTGAGVDLSYINNSSISNIICNDNGTFGMNVTSNEETSYTAITTSNNSNIGFRDNGGNIGKLTGLESYGNSGAPAQMSSPRLYSVDVNPEIIGSCTGTYAPVRDLAISSQLINCGNILLGTVTTGSGNVLAVSGLNVGQSATVLFNVTCTLKSISGGGGAKFQLASGADTSVAVGDIYKFIVKSGSTILAIKQ